MKKIVTLVMATMLFVTTLNAQTLKGVVRDFQRKNSEFTMVIPSFLIKMGLVYGDMEEEERQVLEMIHNMKIVISKNHFRKTDFPMLEEGLKNGEFEELMTVRDRNEKVRMIMNQKSERKSEMLMLVESDDENVLLLFNFHGKPDFGKLLTLVD